MSDFKVGDYVAWHSPDGGGEWLFGTITRVQPKMKFVAIDVVKPFEDQIFVPMEQVRHVPKSKATPNVAAKPKAKASARKPPAKPWWKLW